MGITGTVVRKILAAVATPVADDFNRADGPLGSTSVGNKPWSTSGATWSILSNQARHGSGGTEGRAWVECGSPDGVLRVTQTVNVGGQWGILFRYADDNNYWIAYQDYGSTTVTVEKNVAGVRTAVGGIITNAEMGFGPDNLRVVLSGSSILVYCNNLLTHNITSSDLVNNTKHGMFANQSLHRMDNWFYDIPETAIVDNFNRSDRDLNGDNGWTALSGNGVWAITANQASQSGVASGIDTYTWLTRNAISQTKHVIECQLFPNKAIALAWGWNGPADFYYLRISGGNLTARRYTGSRIDLASVGAAAGNPIIKVSHDFVTGELLIYQNGALSIQISGQTMTLSNSKVALGSFDSDSGTLFFDNFNTTLV